MVAKPLCPLYKNIIKPLDRARYPELRYHFGETTFSYNNNELRTRSSRVLITSRQADILRLLAKNIGNVVSKEMIQEAVWGTVSYANSLAVNVQMTYLRHALQHDATVKIESLKKKGYVLSVISPE